VQINIFLVDQLTADRHNIYFIEKEKRWHKTETETGQGGFTSDNDVPLFSFLPSLLLSWLWLVEFNLQDTLHHQINTISKTSPGKDHEFIQPCLVYTKYLWLRDANLGINT